MLTYGSITISAHPIIIIASCDGLPFVEAWRHLRWRAHVNTSTGWIREWMSVRDPRDLLISQNARVMPVRAYVVRLLVALDQLE